MGTERRRGLESALGSVTPDSTQGYSERTTAEEMRLGVSVPGSRPGPPA